MSILVVEINDAGLRTASDPPAEQPAAESPGYALIDEDGLLTGAAAWDRARLKPRRVNDRFWNELDTKPLARPFPRDVSHADLAHAHLERLWACVRDGVEAVILAIPGTYSGEQLGLLLGIAQACGMPVRGMVDSAVAAASGGYPGKALLHVDLQLHRVVVTELIHEPELVRRQVQATDHAGLSALLDTWGKRVAEIFINRTRFDPLHRASSEQALYRDLPDMLRRLATEEVTEFRLESEGKSHVVEVPRRQLVDAAAGAYEATVQLVRLLKPAGQPTRLLLSHRVAQLPGLQARMARIGDAAIEALPPEAALAGALSKREFILTPDGPVGFVIQLPADDARVEAAATAPLSSSGAREATRRRRPTHVVFEGVAYPISEEPFELGVAIPQGHHGLNLAGPTAGVSRSHCSIHAEPGRVVVEDRSTYGSFLNEQRIDGRAELCAGDRLRLGNPGIELQLIAVQSD